MSPNCYGGVEIMTSLAKALGLTFITIENSEEEKDRRFNEVKDRVFEELRIPAEKGYIKTVLEGGDVKSYPHYIGKEYSDYRIETIMLDAKIPRFIRPAPVGASEAIQKLIEFDMIPFSSMEEAKKALYYIRYESLLEGVAVNDKED